GADFDFFRIGPDGLQVGTEEFKIPPKEVLVVTDVDWLISGGPPGEFHTLELFIKNIAGGGRSGVFHSCITLNDSGQGGINEEMISGFVVSSEGKIEVQMDAHAGIQDRVILRGYLHKE
ncbi:MAG TPA: hypothetical protein VD694_04350, partial [Nitrososphaeraceae archaeon]|nr:hypothetical protein [Nitrososphaeraceae archaeon]